MSTYKDVFLGLADPWIFMSLSLVHLPTTVFTLLKSGDLPTLLSPSALRTAWFASFWRTVGPQVFLGSSRRATPLLEGKVAAGHITPTAQHPPLSGVVIEVGAGNGMWAPILATHPGVTKVYGIEPNLESAASLRELIREKGLEDRYEVIPHGVEDLGGWEGKGGRIEVGSVDCIVSVLCLCSIPEPQRNLAALYGYLKKGGRWYVYEHVKTETAGRVMTIYQAFVEWFWPTIIGGCHIARPTGRWLREAGEWSNIDLQRPDDDPWYHCLPHELGVLTK